MARFEQGNLRLKDNQEVSFDTSEAKTLKYDGTDLAFNTQVQASTPSKSADLTTKAYVDGEISTLSGSIVLDHGSLTGLDDNDHSAIYYTQAQVDGKWATWSGTIDHDTILNNHNLTTDIDHDQLTNFSADEHFTQAAISITESQISDLQDYVTETEFTTYSGTLQTQITANTDALAALDDTYATDAELNTVSGVIVAQIPSLAGYATEAYVTTVSGDIVAQIPTDFYTTGEVDTISGALSAEIDADISSHTHNQLIFDTDNTFLVDTGATSASVGGGITLIYNSQAFTFYGGTYVSPSINVGGTNYKESPSFRVIYGTDPSYYGELAFISWDGDYTVESGTYTVTLRGDVNGTAYFYDRGTTSNVLSMTYNSDKITLANGTGINEFSTDGTLAGNSDDAVPTEKAVKTYVDTEIATISGGTSDHGALTGLDDDDHTQYLLRTDFTTYSGAIVDQIPTDYYTTAEVDTISGALSAEIDSDITTHAWDANAHHNETHDIASHTWANDWMIIYSNGDGLVELPFGDDSGKFLKSAGEAALDFVSITEADISDLQSYLTTVSGGDHTLLTNIGSNSHATIDTHLGSTSNPHTVTAAQVGNGTAQWNANKLQGIDLESGTPSNGQAYIYNGVSGDWEFGNPASSGTNATQLQGYDVDGGAPSVDDHLVWNGTAWSGTAVSAGIANVVEDTTPQLGGDLDINDKYISLDPAPAASGTGNGFMATMTVDANSTGIGAALYIASDGNYEEADASATSTMPCVALALEAGTGSKKVLLQGFFRDDTWNWTPGSRIYVSETTGALTATQPSTSSACVQPVGIATHADRIWFNPTLDYVEVA